MKLHILYRKPKTSQNALPKFLLLLFREICPVYYRGVRNLYIQSVFEMQLVNYTASITCIYNSV